MKQLAHLNDILTKQTREILDLVSEQEIVAWKGHPLTQYMIKRMSLSMNDIHMAWASGEYTEETQAGTIQRNATALGELAAYENILDDIDTVEVARRALHDDDEDEHGS